MKRESAKDRAAEKKFAEQMLRETGEEYVKLPEFSVIDFRVRKDGQYIGYAEFKRRWNHSTYYPDLILDEDKWKELVDHSLWTEAKFWVQYDDCLKWIKADEALKLDVTMAGRRDRGDPNDIEPCVHIPNGRLTLYETDS